MTMLEELFYGNICPAVRHIKKGSEYNRIVQKKAEMEENLVKTLKEREKQIFEKVTELQTDLNCISEMALFKCGFRVGVKLMIDVFTGNDESFENI